MSVNAPEKKKDTPNPYKEGMTDDEARNFDVLKASPKKWTDDEARNMATNPSGRLPPTKKQSAPPSRTQKRYGNSLPGSQ